MIMVGIIFGIVGVYVGSVYCDIGDGVVARAGEGWVRVIMIHSRCERENLSFDNHIYSMR